MLYPNELAMQARRYAYAAADERRAATDVRDVHLAAATALVRAYTRGRGFEGWPADVPDDIAAVIVALTVRFSANPAGARSTSTTAKDATVASTWHPGLTLLEQLALNGYRRRTA